MVKIKLKERMNHLKQQRDRSKIYLQELNSETQKTLNDVLILTGRILELEEILKEQEQQAPPEIKENTNGNSTTT